MAENAPKRIEQIAGIVGRDPEVRPTSAGDTVKFTVAVKRAYGVKGDDGNWTGEETQWYDATVWNADLQNVVLNSVQKGNRVVLEGATKERQVDGKSYYDLTVSRIGFVDWILRNRDQKPAGDGLDNI